VANFLPRIPDEEFWALPDEDPRCAGKGWGFLGYAHMKEEGKPIYTDADGYFWTLEECDGARYRAMMV
jgi:hypothetical protein